MMLASLGAVVFVLAVFIRGEIIFGDNDVVLVSAGGSACTYFDVYLQSLRSRDNKSYVVNHLNPRRWMKHSSPAPFIQQKYKLKKGFIYLMGNPMHALKSLVRRHYSVRQSQLLKGDTDFLLAQKVFYSSPHNVSLFQLTPSKERRDMKKKHGCMTLEDERVLVMLEYINDHGEDPLGVLRHYRTWKTNATMGRLKARVLFISMYSLLHPDHRQVFQQYLDLPDTFNTPHIDASRVVSTEKYFEYYKQIYRSCVNTTSVAGIAQGMNILLDYEREMDKIQGNIYP